jgi:hypothetical protein
MDSATFLRCLEAALRIQVQAAGGELHVASDPDHVLEILSASSPLKFHVVMNWAGDEALDPVNSPGIRYFKLATTVQAARGLAISGGDAHRVTAAGREPLLALAGRVDQWVRGFSGDHPDLHKDGFRKLSSDWLAFEDHPIRQIVHTHRCIVRDDRPLDTPCNFTL